MTDRTAAAGTPRHFRFFDNREKYLLFVTTCSEKWAVAERVGRELEKLEPEPPALKIFDAGMGDASVLTRVLRGAHSRFPTVPFQIVCKEISIEDIRLALEKMADRFHEHPQTVLVVTNMLYSEAPWLKPRKAAAAARLNWWEIPLEGTNAHEFDHQIRQLLPRMAEAWETRTSERTGNPLYVEPSVVVFYRADQRFVLDRLLPSRDGVEADYDLVVASQPYRARIDAESKVRNVLVPLARALGPGGRMVVIQSTGRDPGMEVIRKVWPEEDPFQTPGHELLVGLEASLRDEMPDLRFSSSDDEGALFRFRLHALPDELGKSIGTSTLLAAWNAAIYVAQISDDRLTDALAETKYLDSTAEVLRRHGGLWFLDESFVVHRLAREG